MYISTKICEFVHHIWQYEPNTTLSSYLVCHLVFQEYHHNITELLLSLTKTCLKLKDSHEWVTDCCLTSHVHFDKDEDVYLVLEQHAEMDWYK
jgi:hypothetical protein